MVNEQLSHDYRTDIDRKLEKYPDIYHFVLANGIWAYEMMKEAGIPEEKLESSKQYIDYLLKKTDCQPIDFYDKVGASISDYEVYGDVLGGKYDLEKIPKILLEAFTGRQHNTRYYILLRLARCRTELYRSRLVLSHGSKGIESIPYIMFDEQQLETYKYYVRVRNNCIKNHNLD